MAWLIESWPPMIVIETKRLEIRRLSLADAAFILKLLNEPSWLQHIGDMEVRSIPDAEKYIQDGPFKMYEEHGFGLFLVELKSTGEAIGMCGLIKRETLEYPDVGFALFPKYWGQGYGMESAAAAMEYGQREHGLSNFAAITSPNNPASIKLLQKLGFAFERMVRLRQDGEELMLLGVKLEAPAA